MISHQTLRRLVYFAAIAEAGSIRGAAERLNLSVPVLSEALSELEEELGVSLATRTTRHFELTRAGIHTQVSAQDILNIARGLTQLNSAQRALKGTLSLTVPVEIADFWLPEKLTDFRVKHPNVSFDIDVTDSVVNLRSSKIELAIRTDYIAPSEKSRSPINVPLVVVASTAAKIQPDGTVNMALIDSKADRKLVATSNNDAALFPLTFERTHQITNRSAGLQLARQGIGAVLAMKGSVTADLQSGKLAEILPGHGFGSIDVNCHFRDRLPSIIAQTFAREVGLVAA